LIGRPQARPHHRRRPTRQSRTSAERAGPVMSFSEAQIRALQRNVPRRNLRSRIRDGKELTYLEGWYAIHVANRIFGFDGWDRETLETRCVVAREVRGSYSAVYVARVRVAVRVGERVVVRDGHGTG